MINSLLKKYFFSKIDITPLVYFRIAFGFLMFLNTIKFYLGHYIEYYWIIPRFHFHYRGLEWIQAWDANGMYIHMLVIALSAIFICIGLFYRFSSILFFLSWTYLWLIDQCTYNNHFYLISLIALVMIFIPAHRSFSLDAKLFSRCKAEETNSWSLWILRFLIFIPYFYGGIAKINPDWLRAEPIRIWLSSKGSFLAQEWVAYFVAYGGMLFDLFIVPFLIWKRTRIPAFILACAFHLTNHFAFSEINIGIFPWLMIAATALFFDPTPRRKNVK